MKIYAKFVLLFTLFAVTTCVPIDYAAFDNEDEDDYALPTAEREDATGPVEHDFADDPADGYEDDDLKWQPDLDNLVNNDIDEVVPVVRAV